MLPKSVLKHSYLFITSSGFSELENVKNGILSSKKRGFILFYKFNSIKQSLYLSYRTWIVIDFMDSSWSKLRKSHKQWQSETLESCCFSLRWGFNHAEYSILITFGEIPLVWYKVVGESVSHPGVYIIHEFGQNYFQFSWFIGRICVVGRKILSRLPVVACTGRKERY